MNKRTLIQRLGPLYGLLSLAAVLACLSGGDPSYLPGRLARELLAALVACGLWALGRGGLSLRRSQGGCLLLGLVVVGCGVAMGVASWLATGSGPLPHVSSLGAFALLCLATAVAEEVLFRGILLRSFLSAFCQQRDTPNGPGHTRSGLTTASVAAAAVFALLHLGTGIDWTQGLNVAQALLKVAQGLLFALIMTALVVRRRSLDLSIAAHALFNFCSQALAVAQTGTVASTYVTAEPADIIVLGVCVVLFVPLTLRSLAILKREARRAVS